MNKIWKSCIVACLILFIPFLCASAVRAKVYYHGSRSDDKIYLTFDDGYSARNMEKILNTLKRKKVSATFFIEGKFMTENPNLTRRIAAEQILANHTYSHVDITTLSNQAFIKELKTFENKAYEITGKQITKYFRPPMGRFNEENLQVLGDMGYTMFMWDVQYYDYVYYDDQGVDYVMKKIMGQTQNGSIILMHTLTNSNADALANVIDALRRKGFVFDSLNNLL